MAFFSHFMAFFLKNRLGCFPGPTLKNIMALKNFVIFGLIFFLMAFFFLNEINVFRVRPEGNRRVGERSKEPPGRDVPSQLFKWPFRGL